MTHVWVSEKDLHSWILYYTYVVTLNQTEHVLTCVPIFCKAPVGLKNIIYKYIIVIVVTTSIILWELCLYV